MKQTTGYTLLEMIVVIAIISILTAFAIPSVVTWLHQYRLQAAATTMMNHLRAARLLAIFTGKKHQMQIRAHDEGNYYQVVEDPEDEDLIVMSIGRIDLTKRFKEVRIKKLTQNGLFTFKPRGTSTSGSFVLENSENKQIKITINGFGRIKSEYL